jgi:dynactin-6
LERHVCCSALHLPTCTDTMQYCTISPSSYVPPNTRLPDYTIVYSGSEQRTDRTLQLRPEILNAKIAVHAKQLDMFKKLIPNNMSKWAI